MSTIKKKLNTVLLPIIIGTVTVVAVGCLDDYMDQVDVIADSDEYEECDIAVPDESFRCNDGEVEICRVLYGNRLWRKLEDCTATAGGVCPLPAGEISSSKPVCTGEYWETSYCPGAAGPASTDCKDISENMCCDTVTPNVVGDSKALVCVNGDLWCYQCGAYDATNYNSTTCGWSVSNEVYGCYANDYYGDPNAPDVLPEDPTGTLQAACVLDPNA